jgi:predicted RNA-binding protein Jag
MNNELKNYLINIINIYCKGLMISPVITFDNEKKQYRINLEIDNHKILTSYENELLYCMQYFIRVAIHKKFPADRTHFLLDVNGNRINREKVVLQVIPDLVIKQVVEKGIPVIINNLNGYERKLLHDRFDSLKGITTRSLGDDKQRKFIIESVSEVGVSGLDSATIYDIDKLTNEYKSMIV